MFTDQICEVNIEVINFINFQDCEHISDTKFLKISFKRLAQKVCLFKDMNTNGKVNFSTYILFNVNNL